ncbi:MAG: sodium-dependent bicarbonate transport family permease [Microscillaceae bacterium]|nr:sodium-dependent bicarbonate transport family permease [Microscillaceae bacterium]
MDLELLVRNLTNPTLLFFCLGILAQVLKSDLEVPETSARFIALYLLFAIGFKGGQELVHNPLTPEIGYGIAFGLALATIIPLYTFFLLRTRLSVHDAGAIAAAYGSVSAVTFVTADSFLELQNIAYGGHMVAIMALMEAPAIIVGVILIGRYDTEASQKSDLGGIVRHSFTNGSVLMILGSLVIGIISDSEQAEGIKPFTNDIFKGFLAIFLLEMGIVTARRFAAFRRYGWFASLFALAMPLVNGSGVAWLSGFISQSAGDRLMFAVLAAGASYIAVPAAMRLAAPRSDPGLYIPMALGVTFPFNITLGLPLYMSIIRL